MILFHFDRTCVSFVSTCVMRTPKFTCAQGVGCVNSLSSHPCIYIIPYTISQYAAKCYAKWLNFKKIEKLLLFSAQAIQSIQTVNCGKNMKKMQKTKC